MVVRFKDIPLYQLPGPPNPGTDSLILLACRHWTTVVPALDETGSIRAFSLASCLTSCQNSQKEISRFSGEIIHALANDEVYPVLSSEAGGDRLIVVSEAERTLGWTTVHEALIHFFSMHSQVLREATVRDQHICLSAGDTVYTAHKQLFNGNCQLAIIMDKDGRMTGALSDHDIGRCIEEGRDIWNTLVGDVAQRIAIVNEDLSSDQFSISAGDASNAKIVVVTNAKGAPTGFFYTKNFRRRGADRETDRRRSADPSNPSEPFILDTVLNNSLRTGIVGTDEYLNVIYFNEALIDFVNNPGKLGLGGAIWEVTDSCGISRQSFASYLEGARNNREQVIVNWVKIKNMKRYIQCRLAKIDSQEHIAGFVMSVQDITAQRNAEDAIRKLAYQDRLTQLPNRLLFDERLDHEEKRARRNGTKFAIMMLDLDGFKKVNDDYGHTAGDELLCTVGRRLQASIRETDTVARFGGDEFVFILPDIAHEEDVTMLAEKMRSVIRQQCDIGEKEVEIDASMGFSIYPDDSSDPQELLDLADTRMYKDKRKE